MAEILCSTCGEPNTDDHNFCDHCGAPLFSVEPLPPDSPSLRDDLFDNDDDLEQAQQPAPQDDGSRLDSLLPPEEPLEEPPKEQSQTSEPMDEFSRLDDLVPAPGTIEDTPADEPSSIDDSLTSIRLDDLLKPEEPHGRFEPEKDEAEPPAFDPFLDPSARDELLGEEIPGETSGGEWEYLTDPSVEETLSTSSAPPAEDPPDTAEFLSSLSDESSSETESPALESSEEWDILASPSTEEDPPTQKPAEDPVDGWDFLSPTSAEEDPPTQKPAEDPVDGWDFLSPTSAEEDPLTQKPAEDPVAEWDFLASTSSEEEPPTQKPAEDPVDGWDFLTSSSAEEEPALDEEKRTTKEPGSELSGDFEFLSAADGEGGFADLDHPKSEENPELNFLTPDPESEPGPIGFRPDLYDEDEDPLPEFGSPGFSEDSGWLDMLQDPDSREAAAEIPPEPTKPQTDWLDKIKRLNKSSDLVDEDSSFPDWLSVSERQEEKIPEEEKPPEIQQPPADIEDAAPASDLPAWLQIDGDDESLNAFLKKKDLTNEEYKPAIVRGITDKLPKQEDDDDDEPASGLSDSQQIKFPSWAEEKKKAEEAAVPEDLEFLAGTEEGDESVIDPFQMEEEEFFDDLFSDELPGWLTSTSHDNTFEGFEDELSLGELPGWVEAMRPVVESSDAAGLSEDDDYIENYGPLAGIPSVLPAEAEVAFDPEKAARKPLDLLSTKSHQDYVNVLKKLITSENKTKTILKPAPVATQRVLRWLIAIIMLVTTAGTVIFGGTISTEPPTYAQVQNTGYGALYDQIEGLYDGEPVLVAFDYQPAAAGELHTAAAGVVDHLIKQGTYLSFISTQPTGPALAEHFLETTQEIHEYTHTQQYINLGYLPGESAGLLSFVIAPKQIIPLAFDGSNAWGSPPLLRVNSINDFAMVLVITDDPETAKIWIEQVATILDDTPLNMVVSAQAEPLIQPYFRASPQLLKGYVSGIIDSMNYELLLDRPNLATRAWLPFNLGIIITVGTIFIGGLANGVLSLFSRHRSRTAGDGK